MAAAAMATEVQGPPLREHFALMAHRIWVRPATVYSYLPVTSPVLAVEPLFV